MRIRPYEDKDYPELEAILKDSNLHYDYIDKREVYKKQSEENPESIMVAEDEGKVIGSFIALYSPWASIVYHLCVHEDYRRKGIATKLMDRFEETAREHGCGYVALYVMPDNDAAVEFYKKRDWFKYPLCIPMGKEL